jgi:hypothetical protein
MLLAAGTGLLVWGRARRAPRVVRLARLASAAWVGAMAGTLVNGWLPVGWVPVPTWLTSAALALGGGLVAVAIAALARGRQ